MKAYIVRNMAGVFAVGEKGNELDSIIFKRDPEEGAKKLLSEAMTAEEGQLIDRLKGKGYSEFILPRKIEPYNFEENSLGERVMRGRLRDVLKDKDANGFLTQVGIEITRMRIKETVKKDKIVIQAINTMDEIEKSINIFMERLREWYGLHFPEFEKAVDRHEKFVKIVAENGLRDKIKDEEFIDSARVSMGLDLSETDEEILKLYAEHIRALYRLKERMEKYIEVVMKEIAPNFTELAGPLLGARLIALVGGLDRLAKKASSTIQLLGSEKALFRYLSGKGRAPKHGVLFQSPYIQKAPLAKRGKVARIVSSKLSIAVKMDYYGSPDKSKQLKDELDALIKKAMED
ncbi:hypothetical protein A3K63_04470 [Candidatus Micrarchaeota archaeon RBG_16_49_10]|nr:MAG: hypothetical protein A3K63_04470 [Candidatus Micrarchaeota archaeon RBG_16_49_10]